MVNMHFDKYDTDLQELLIQCMGSLRLFCKTFFPEEFESPFSVLHDRIFKVLEGPGYRKALAAPRGVGKTTLIKARVAKAILFREVSFIIYLSNSEGAAEMQTEHIKRMLQGNETITKLFGDVKFSQRGVKDSFSKKAWVAFGDVFVLPRGAGQQVRGLNWMGKRPGLIVVDDLENTDNIRSEDQRKRLKQWFYSDLMKTESRYGTPAEFDYIDTIKHEDALLQNLIDAEDWISDVISICDEEFNTYDPNYMTTEEIKQSYAEHKAAGESDLFYMEYMNIPISLKDATFKPEYFKYFEESGGRLLLFHDVNTLGMEGQSQEPTQTMIRAKDLVTVVIGDPAKTANMTSADSAVIVVSIDRKSQKIFVRDTLSGKITPDVFYDWLFSSVLLYDARVLAVEVTGLNNFISQPIENEMHVRGIFPTFLQLHAKGDKDLRISSIAVNYRLGYMYHNKNVCTKLENQLIWHPKSKLKDLADALSYINVIMEEHHMLFDPNDDETEDEFNELELENEEPLDNWRVA